MLCKRSVGQTAPSLDLVSAFKLIDGSSEGLQIDAGVHQHRESEIWQMIVDCV